MGRHRAPRSSPRLQGWSAQLRRPSRRSGPLRSKATLYCLNLVSRTYPPPLKVDDAIKLTKKRFRSDEQRAGLSRSNIFLHAKRLRDQAAADQAVDQAAADQAADQAAQLLDQAKRLEGAEQAGKASVAKLAGGTRRTVNQKMAKTREDARHRENYNEAFHEACSRRWKSLQDRRVKQHLMKPTSCRAIRDEVVAEMASAGKILHKPLVHDLIMRYVRDRRYTLVDGKPVFIPDEIGTPARKMPTSLLALGMSHMQLTQAAGSASAGFRDRRIGDRGHCVWIHEVQLGDIGVVVGVGVGGGGNNRCVQHGEVDGRSGTRAALPALDGDGSPLPRHRVRKW